MWLLQTCREQWCLTKNEIQKTYGNEHYDYDYSELTQYLEEEESNKEKVSMEPNIFECDCNHVFRILSWDTSSNFGIKEN